MRVLLIGTNHYLPTWGLKKRLKKFQPDAVFLEMPENVNKKILTESKNPLIQEALKSARFSKENNIEFHAIDKPQKAINESLTISNINPINKLIILLFKISTFILFSLLNVYVNFLKLINKYSKEEAKEKLSKELMERDKHMFKKIKKHSKRKRRIYDETGTSNKKIDVYTVKSQVQMKLLYHCDL